MLHLFLPAECPTMTLQSFAWSMIDSQFCVKPYAMEMQARKSQGEKSFVGKLLKSAFEGATGREGVYCRTMLEEVCEEESG
jgi:hypothetical protein